MKSAPVNLVSPIIRPVFPAINLAPQATVVLPQVNTKLNCFDIACQPVTNINACPTVKPMPNRRDLPIVQDMQHGGSPYDDQGGRDLPGHEPCGGLAP